MMHQLPLDLRVYDHPSFENFWPGKNAVALDLVRTLVAGAHGPLYLFGPEGSGKTHLLLAAARAAAERGAACAYLSLAETSEAQWEGLVDIRSDAMVCIDDIDGLHAQPQWEHRLFVLLESLAPLRRIIFAGRSNPAGLALGRDDLGTRLASGPVLALRALSDEAKGEALRHRASIRGLSLSASAVHYLLTHGPRDLGALFHLLARLDQETLVDGRKLTIPYLRQVLARL